MKTHDINQICLTFAIGQLHPDASAFTNLEAVNKHVRAFNNWEKENVLCLANGWEGYTVNGGEDYETVIYEWAKNFRL